MTVKCHDELDELGTFALTGWRGMPKCLYVAIAVYMQRILAMPHGDIGELCYWRILHDAMSVRDWEKWYWHCGC